MLREMNAITDVQGVKVGHVTIHEGEGALQAGQGPVRTGVTVIIRVKMFGIIKFQLERLY